MFLRIKFLPCYPQLKNCHLFVFFLYFEESLMHKGIYLLSHNSFMSLRMWQATLSKDFCKSHYDVWTRSHLFTVFDSETTKGFVKHNIAWRQKKLNLYSILLYNIFWDTSVLYAVFHTHSVFLPTVSSLPC